VKRFIISLLTFSLLTAACGDAADGSGDTNAPTTTSPPTSAAPPTTSPDGTLEPAPVDREEPTAPREDDGGMTEEEAAADLAERLGVAVTEIIVNEVETVTWRTGALGCPQPGMSYTQALVPGVRLILEHGGDLYYYHGTSANDLFYCENPSDPLPGDAGDA